MVKSNNISKLYYQLIDLLNVELVLNKTVIEFITYLKNEEDSFNSSEKIESGSLTEFIRGANRYSDEFIFSDLNYPEIRKLLNSLYEALSEKKH